MREPANHILIEYYEQRSCTPGTLIISEATLISRNAAGAKNAPGIWSNAQVSAWKDITDAIHAKGCKIFCQLWHQGRAGKQDILEEAGSKLFSSSAIAVSPDFNTPTAMTEEDITRVIGDFVAAARNAIAAGFDGVEIHGANGYLADQFLQDTCNQRTDRWGGSLRNRVRFHIEVLLSVIAAVGADKTAVRLSPYSDFLGMLMDNPEPTFQYLLEEIKPMGLAYLHIIEARIRGNDDAECGAQKTVKWMVEQWDNATPVLLAGGFTAKSAEEAVDYIYNSYDVVIVFGRYFVANPDLVFRIKSGVRLDKYERTYFYTPGMAKGYIDYPFSHQFTTTRAIENSNYISP